MTKQKAIVTTPSAPSMTTSILVTTKRAKSNDIAVTGNLKNRRNQPEKDGNGDTVTIVIVVCVCVICMSFAVVVVVWFLRHRGTSCHRTVRENDYLEISSSYSKTKMTTMSFNIMDSYGSN